MHEFHIWYFWWLIFPIMGFAMGAYRSWLRYRRHKDLMDLVRAYATQGRDPPPELMARLAGESVQDSDRPYRGGGRGMWLPAIILLSLSAAFTVLMFVPGGPGGNFIFPAVILGALGLAFLGIAAISRRLGDPTDAGRDGR